MSVFRSKAVTENYTILTFDIQGILAEIGDTGVKMIDMRLKDGVIMWGFKLILKGLPHMDSSILQDVPNHINRLNSIQESSDSSKIFDEPVLEIPDLVFKNKIFVEIDGEIVTVFLAKNLKFRPDKCPHCGSKSLHLNKKTAELVRHIPNPNPTFVYYLTGKFVCPHCHKCSYSTSGVTYGQCSYTQALAKFVVRLFNKDPMLTDKSLATFVGLHEYQVTRILDSYTKQNHCSDYRLDVMNHALENDQKITVLGTEVDPKFFCPFKLPKKIERVMIDEVAIEGRNYITHFVDADTGENLFYAQGNGKAAIQQFCHWGRGRMAEMLYVTCDMNACFARAFKESGLNVTITHDKFHVFKNMSEHCSNALKIVAKHLSSEHSKHLLSKEIQTLFFTKSINLKDKEKTKLNEVLNYSDEIKNIYCAVQGVYDSFDSSMTSDEIAAKLKGSISIFAKVNSQGSFVHYEEDMDILYHYNYRLYQAYNYTKLSPEERMDYITNRECHECAFQKSMKNSPLTKIMLLLHKHLDSLVTFASTKLTSSPIEGFNNGFKECKHSKFGIKDIFRFELRLKLRSMATYLSNVKVATLQKCKTTLN